MQSAAKTTYADGFAVQNNNIAVKTLSQFFHYELIRTEIKIPITL